MLRCMRRQQSMSRLDMERQRRLLSEVWGEWGSLELHSNKSNIVAGIHQPGQTPNSPLGTNEPQPAPDNPTTTTTTTTPTPPSGYSTATPSVACPQAGGTTVGSTSTSTCLMELSRNQQLTCCRQRTLHDSMQHRHHDRLKPEHWQRWLGHRPKQLLLHL